MNYLVVDLDILEMVVKKAKLFAEKEDTTSKRIIFSEFGIFQMSKLRDFPPDKLANRDCVTVK